MSIQPDQKTDLLFKQFTGVANIFHDPTDFSVQPKGFTPAITNKSIYSRDIPNNIAGITAVNGFGITLYGTQALDLSYGDASANIGLTVDLGNNLRYYHRLPLDKVQSSDQAYYKLDACGNNILQDTIPFKYDAEFDSYFQSLYIYDSATNNFQFQTLGGGVYKWLLDYQSGYVQFYGDPTNIILSPTQKPCISFVKYTGPKGAGGGSIGGDMSYNNLIIDSSLIAQDGVFENLTVNQTANLPEETLIKPRFDKLSGTHITNHPFFDPEYPVTKQYDAFNINYTENPVTENDWVTIARCGEVQPSNADGRADALFKVTHASSGRHETISFIATKKYGRGFAINVLQHDWYSGPNFKALRIAYNSTYQGGVVQLQFTSNLGTTNFNHPLAINIVHNYDYPGWELYTDTSGSRIADGREVFYVIPDNNPQSQNTNTFGLTYPLNNEFKLENLDWDPNAGTLGGANQMTTNPARFTRQVDVKGELTLLEQNLLKVVEYPFYSEATPTHPSWPTTPGGTPVSGSLTGYYQFATVDNLRKINPSKNNMAYAVMSGDFTFYTRLNIEDSGFNNVNKLSFNGDFTIGVNQTYDFAVNPAECFIHTKNCLTETNTPFKTITMLKNDNTNQYELYLYYESPGTSSGYRDKIIDLTIQLKGNDNINPTIVDLSGNTTRVLNWELLTPVYIGAALPTTNTFIRETIDLKPYGERIWSGTTKPFYGKNSVASFGKFILQNYNYDSTNPFDDDGKVIAQATAYDPTGATNTTKVISINGTFRLLAKYESGAPTDPIYTHEIVFTAGVQSTGTGGGVNNNTSTFLNILSNNFSHEGNPIIQKVVMTKETNSFGYFYNIYIIHDSLTTSHELDISLYNNDINNFTTNELQEVSWQLGRDQLGGSNTSNINRQCVTTISSQSTFNQDITFFQKISFGNGDANGTIITEDTTDLETNLVSNISSDGTKNLIVDLSDGGLVIDAKTAPSTAGGLKIFNSGGTYNTTLSSPQISLIPYINSGGAGTLGNPTTISVNDDEATIFKGSGNLSLYTGLQDFGSFNIYQSDGTTLASSNVINSKHLNGTEYHLSLNHSRNDTDVIINTPNYNILDPPQLPAMIADSGTDTITFNAPVIFNNDVNISQEFTFNTSNISPDDWFTLAQTGDGSDRNQLRSDAKFILEDRLGSHHHTLIFKAGAKFNSGIYINVLESSWFSTPRIRALRIAYNSTYDGSVLQAQLNSDSGSQSSSNLKLRIYQNRNEQGWFCDISGSPSATNNPTCYVVTGSSNGFGTAYPNFREAGNVIYDPNGRNTTQITTNNFVVQQSTLTVENSSGVNIECNQSPGNIVLDTIGNTVPPGGATRGISLASHEGMLLQCNNNSSASNPGVFVVDGNVWYFNTGGFNMNGKNIVGATKMESDTFTRNSASTISIGELTTATSGNYINMKEPTLIYRTSNSNGTNYLNNLGGGAFPTAANGIQFFDSGSENQFPVQRRGFSSLPTPLYTNWAQTSPYRFECVIATSIRNGTTTSNKRLTSTTSYLDHASSDGWSAYEVSSTGQGTSVFLTRHLLSYDCLIKSVTVQPMGLYCSINNTTGSSKIVDFELWITYEDGAATGTNSNLVTVFFYSTGWPANMLTTDIKNNNTNSNYARKIKTRTATITNGGSAVYNPFLTGTNAHKPEILNVDPPLYVPKGKAVIVHAVERRVSSISSGYIEFTTYAYGQGGSGHASGAMVCNIIGEINFNS
uniref:Uncharacterized protein n=1 Tax=viral metagenome TaxID=1070528 RepID=A0A6C0CSH5_9ZZZZ